MKDIETVLNILCENGILAIKFLKKGKKVIRIDYSEVMLKSFKKTLKIFKI